MEQKPVLEQDRIREQIADHLKSVFQMEDVSGIELLTTLQRAAVISEVMEGQLSDELDLSGPRWRLLLLLFIHEHTGRPEQITPTMLSHVQRVSKNTISALLRGLEEQGLIQRALDPADLRTFHIQLTDAGREIILRTGPHRLEGLNQLVDGLSPEECQQLIGLLEKFLRSLAGKMKCQAKPENRG